MDPNLMLKMMDPAFRNNPEEMQKLAREMRRGARSEILRSVRLNGLIMLGVGVAMLGVGVVLGVIAIVHAATERRWHAGEDPLVFVGSLLTFMGAIFAVLGRMFGVPSPMQGGVPSSAKVLIVKSLGRSVGITKPGMVATLTKINLTFSVQTPQGMPIEVPYSEYVVSSDLRFLHVGATVPVRIDPNRPTRVTVDWDRIGEG
jgi:hypothetical protein